MKAIHKPLIKLPLSACQTPKKIKRKPKKRPVNAAMLVARRNLPVIHQTIARKTRPPSSGKPGIRLKIARIKFRKARYFAKANKGGMGIRKGSNPQKNAARAMETRG